MRGWYWISVLAMGVGLLPGGLAFAWGYSGERPIEIRDHLQHPRDEMVYTEQWSATIVFAPGHDLNINLVHSNLGTKRKKAVFRVEYKEPGVPKLKEESRCGIHNSAAPFKLSCGAGTISGSPENLTIAFSGAKIKLVARLSAQAPAFRPKDGRLHDPKSEKDFYDFMLMIPRGEAQVTLNDKALKGYGSLDHSYANTGFQNISRHWARATYHDDEISILFAVNRQKSGEAAGWLAVADNQGRHYASADLTATLADPLNDAEKRGYASFRALQLASTKGDGASLAIRGMTQNSRRDLLADLNAFEAFIVRRFSDPIRYSMAADALLTWPAHDGPQTTRRALTVIIKQVNP